MRSRWPGDLAGKGTAAGSKDSFHSGKPYNHTSDVIGSSPLNTFVAGYCGLEEDLGKKGTRGIVKSTSSREQFLADGSHTIVFHYTPKHASWMNQIELWFSILARKVLRHGSFTSTQDLTQRLVRFIEYFNEMMAKPFKWTYKPLTA
jgi:putative transposase